MKKETMLEAFLRQTEIDDKKADARDKTLEELGEHLVSSALNGSFGKNNINEAIEIPSQLKSEENIHADNILEPGQKGFTEVDRWKHIGGKIVTEDGLDDGSIEMGDMGSEI